MPRIPWFFRSLAGRSRDKWKFHQGAVITGSISRSRYPIRAVRAGDRPKDKPIKFMILRKNGNIWKIIPRFSYRRVSGSCARGDKHKLHQVTPDKPSDPRSPLTSFYRHVEDDLLSAGWSFRSFLIFRFLLFLVPKIRM